MSRNAREGYYVGKWRGRHLRQDKITLRTTLPGSVMPLSFRCTPDSDYAWMLASKRAGQSLPVRRPRYSKGRRAALDAYFATSEHNYA